MIGTTNSVVIEGGKLIDCTGRAALEDSMIVIEGSRIRAVGTARTVSRPPDATTVNASGKTVLPGLIDGHIHFLDFMGPLFLRFGVTTVFDLGNVTDWIVSQREAIKRQQIKGPRIFTTGLIIDGPAPPHQPTIPELEGYHIHVDSVEDARLAARDTICRGVDAIKVHEHLGAALLKAILQESHRAGLEVVGHCHNAWEAAAIGLRFIEHTSPVARACLRDPATIRAANEGWLLTPEADMDPELFDPLIGELVEKGTYLNPTLTRMWSRAMPKRDEWRAVATKCLKEDALHLRGSARHDKWLEVSSDTGDAKDLLPTVRTIRGFQKVSTFVSNYSRAGGKIIAGSDSGPSSDVVSLPGMALHFEMEALVDAGLNPMQALLAATKWPAELLRLEKDLGTVEPDKIADLVIIEGDPLSDIRVTRNVHTVIIEGKIVDTSVDPQYRNPLPRPVTADSLNTLMIPQVTGLIPRIAHVGDPPMEIEVTGHKFTRQSIVRFDVTNLPTRYISDSQLKATLNEELFRYVGTYAITVTNPGSGGGTAHPKYFMVAFERQS